MRGLAEGAVRMCHTARMDVREFQRGPKEQQERKQRDKQNPRMRIRCPKFADPSHNYYPLYLRTLKSPILEYLIAGVLRPL
jgi:hypothetical protein